MKKILSFFAVLLMAMTASATIRNITPTHCFEGDRNDGYTLYVELARGAQNGDTIMLADGTYIENQSLPVEHNVVVMAAPNAQPIVQMKGYFQIHATVKFVGIKFVNAAGGQGYCMYFYENNTKNLVLENCGFENFTQYCVSSWEDFHVDSIVVNNCYFHNLAKGPFYLKASERDDLSNTCDYLEIKNSTFNDIDINGWVSVIDIRNDNGESGADHWVGNNNKLVVDHCTFYNIHGVYNRVIMSYKSTDAHVTNCIFANPGDSASYYPTYNYGGEVLNNLTYNMGSHRSGPTRTGNITGDPFFVDAANGDFTLSVGEGGNYSPALRAGTNGEILGDPHWWPSFNVRGTMNEWSATEDEMAWDDTKHIYFKQLDLLEGTYQFKINHGAWAADWGGANIAGSLGEVALSNESGNIAMTTDGRPVIVYFDLANNVVWVDYLYPKVMVAGNFTEPAWQGILMDDEDALSCHITITVPEGRWEFKIIDNNVWYGANGDVDRTNCTNWTLFKEGDPGYDPNINTGLLADIPGDYVLTYTYATKKLDIVYPTSFTRNAANDNYQTLCVPFNASITNAEVYEFVDVANGAVTIQAIDPVVLVAGKSYIVKPSGNMEITKVGEGQVSNPIFPSGTGLYGVLGAAYTYVYDTESTKQEPWVNNYVLTAEDNLFHEVVAGGAVTIKSTRAYLHLATPVHAPGLRIVEAENGATNIQNVEGNEAAVKFIKNGQLYIQKDGVTYTAAGVAVK